MTVKSISFATLSVLEISRWKNGIYTLHPLRRTKNSLKLINISKDFTLTKSDKQYVCAVMYFTDLQKYKLRTAHYYFYPPKYFDKN